MTLNSQVSFMSSFTKLLSFFMIEKALMLDLVEMVVLFMIDVLVFLIIIN